MWATFSESCTRLWTFPSNFGLNLSLLPHIRDKITKVTRFQQPEGLIYNSLGQRPRWAITILQAEGLRYGVVKGAKNYCGLNFCT